MKNFCGQTDWLQRHVTKILSVMILIAALIVGGCSKNEMTIDSSQNNEIKISATNASDGGGIGYIKIPDGSALHVDAKISAGKLIILVEGKEHIVDKTGESFIDVPTGERDLRLNSADGLTGEIILSARPKN